MSRERNMQDAMHTTGSRLIFWTGKQTFHVWLRNVLFGDHCSIIQCRKSQKHSCHLLAPLLTTVGRLGLGGKAGRVFGRIHQAWGQLCSTRDWSQILSHVQPPSMERRKKKESNPANTPSAQVLLLQCWEHLGSLLVLLGSSAHILPAAKCHSPAGCWQGSSLFK